MKKTAFIEKTLPVYLLGALIVIMLITVFTQAQSYGLTTDQALHDSYGHSVFDWYITFGQNRSFLNYAANAHVPEHGAVFDVIVYVAQRIFQHQWYTEAVITALVGVLGVVGIALCGFELGGWWFGLLAAISLWLYPRFFGAIFNNPKDIPFTSATIFVLWSVLRLVKQWNQEKVSLRGSLLVAFCLAVAMAIRVTAITWYALLGLLLICWWLDKLWLLTPDRKFIQVLKQQVLTCGIIGVGSFLGTMLMWPYILINPLVNLHNAIVVNARYPWNGSVLYQGKSQLAAQLPRSFAPVWLVIASPPALILFALIGLLFFSAWSARKKGINPLMLVVVLAVLIPMSMIISLHAVLYNGLRQFLFVVPALILLAVYGLFRLFEFLQEKKQTALTIALALLTIGNFAWLVGEMVQLHPYEYVYFSPLVGGVTGANGQYEIDYWNSCQRAASEWLGQHYQQFITGKQPTIQAAASEFQYMPFLPHNFQAVQHDPDFLIDVAPFKTQQKIGPYALVHTESVEGVPLCKVYRRSE